MKIKTITIEINHLLKYRNIRKLLVFSFLSIFSFLNLNSQILKVFSDIPGRTASNKYICKVRQLAGDTTWKDAFVIQTTCKPSKDGDVDKGYFEKLNAWSASYIAFEFSETMVEVEISKVGGAPITKAMVRPEGHASAARIANGKAYVVFTKNTNVNVDIDGQMEDQYTGSGYTGSAVHTISLFGNPVFKVPSITNPRVKVLNPGDVIPLGSVTTWDTVYFKPGVHNIDTSYIIWSNKVLYIPGDAIVHGTIHPKEAWGGSKFWSVYGSGAISGENITWTGDQNKGAKTFTNNTEGVRLEGFVVLDPANHTFNMAHSGTSINIYKNIKIFGWRKNADGINAFADSEISDCFIRTQDDIFYLGSNVKIHDITTWNDGNGAVMFLTNSDANSYFKNIRVIYHRASYHYWGGGRVISMRDCDNGISNVLFQNIIIEDPFPAFAPFYGQIVAGTVPLTFSNIVFENVRQNAKCVGTYSSGNEINPLNTLKGISDTRKFTNITFKNCSYNGKYLRSFADGDFLTNSYLSNINFLITPENRVTITTSLYPNSSSYGTVTPTSSYDTSELVTLVATPTACNVFVNWTEKVRNYANTSDSLFEVTKNSTYTFSAQKSRTLIANFIGKPVITLNVNNSNGGTTSGNGCFNTGTDITVTATAKTGYKFLKWTETAKDTTVSTSASYKFTVKSSRTLKANFSPAFIVTVSVKDNIGGSVTGGGTIISGDSVTVSATAAQGFQFVSWLDGTTVVSTKASYKFKVTSARTLKASFIQTYNVALSVNETVAGSVTGNGSYKKGDSATIKASVTSGYQFVNWTDGNAVFSTDSIFKFYVNKAFTLVANFSAVTSVNIISDNECKIYPNPVYDIINIEFKNSDKQKEIIIINNSGQEVYSTNTNEANVQIDTKNLNISGNAIVRIVTENTVKSYKIFIK